MNALGDGSSLGVRIRYSVEPYLLETGGGIKHALPLLGGEDFVVVSSDTASDFDPGDLPSILAGDSLAHLVLVDNPSHHPEGDFSLGSDSKSIGKLSIGKLSIDKLSIGEKGLTYAGVGVFSPALFMDSPDGAFKLRLLMDRAIDQGRMTGQHYAGFWLDVGTIERYRTLQQHYGDRTSQ